MVPTYSITMSVYVQYHNVSSIVSVCYKQGTQSTFNKLATSVSLAYHLHHLQ